MHGEGSSLPLNGGEGLPPLSRTWSLLYFVTMQLFWWLLAAALLVAMAGGEHLVKGTAFWTPLQCRNVLGFLGPIGSMCAMSSPLLSVYRAVRRGSPDHGLQTHLIGAFALNAVIGLCYGWRRGLVAVQASSWASLAVQTIGLAGVYSLSRIPDVSVKATLDWFRNTGATFYFLIDRLNYERVAETAKWIAFMIVMALGIMSAAQIFMWVPLDSVLTPTLAISNILPYVATFSTFKNDLKTFRLYWATLSPGDQELPTGPPGVDLFTLSIMHLNNFIWIFYGSFLPDIAIITSSVVALVATSTQLNGFFLPVVIVRLQHFNKPGVPTTSRRVDPGWIFLGDYALMINAIRSPPESPLAHGHVELSTTTSAGGHAGGPIEGQFSTATKTLSGRPPKSIEQILVSSGVVESAASQGDSGHLRPFHDRI